MTKDILFISDWAGYPGLYPDMTQRCEFMLPFIQHSERDVFERMDRASDETLVAWSLGAHMALKRWNRVVANFDRIVLVSPFLSFTDYASEKTIRQMIREMRENPQETVRQYHRQSGFPGSMTIREHDIEGLFAGLEYLRSSRAMPSHLGGEKTTIVHGEFDRIVNPHASEDIWEIMPEATYSALSHGHWIPGEELATLAGL